MSRIDWPNGGATPLLGGPQHRHHGAVVGAGQGARGGGGAEQAGRQQPGEEPRGVHVAGLVHCEPGALGLAYQLGEPVAPVVADGGVEPAVEQLERGYEHGGPAVWLEAVADLAQRFGVVFDVLEHVQQHDGVVPLVAGGRGQVTVHDADVAAVGQPFTEQLDRPLARLAGRQLAKFGEVLGEGAVARADLEDAAAKVRLDHRGQPLGVVHRAIE